MNKPAIPPIDLVTFRQAYEASLQAAHTQFLRLVMARGLTSGVELGVGFGGNCASLLAYKGIESLAGVDPYTHRAGAGGPSGLPQRELDRVHSAALDRLAKFGRRFDLIRQDPADAADRFADGSLDFVYLDADPGDESVRRTLGAWLAKVRPGGVIAGHKYENPEAPGVQQAVDAFFQRLGWPVVHPGDGVWWVQTQRLAISYIIPAYNAEATLWQAAQSVLEDNLEAGDELIVVNDGSTDATGEVIAALAEQHPAVRVLTHQNNQGAGRARNAGIEAAAHGLIFMLDADNVLPTDAVRPLREHLVAAHADAVCCGRVRLFRDGDEPGQTAWVHHYPPGKATLGQYCSMQDPPGAAGNLLFTRDAWQRAGGYPEDAGPLDSWGLGLRLVATGSTLAVCPDADYDHRIGHDSYWQRQHQPGPTDRAAYTILRPFLGRLTPASQFYILQSDNQSRWFSDIADRPLRVVGEPRGRLLPTLAHNIHGIRQRLVRLVTRAA